MSRRIPPHVNASLIREGRMIFQQIQKIIGGREDNYYSMRAAEARAKASQPVVLTLKCGKCMELSGKPSDAVTVYNGYALCQSHANIAMIPENRPKS